MKTPTRILIVEDERIVAFNLQQRLTHMGYEVPAVAVNGRESLDLVHRTRPDLVLMDIHIEGDMDGIEVASQLKRTHSVPVIYLTAYSEDSTLERARETKPYGYLIKPFSERELHATIQMALERHAVEDALIHSQIQLQQALSAASMGIVELDTTSHTINATPHAANLLGWTPEQPTTLATLLSSIDASDRDGIAGKLQDSIAKLKQFSDEFRVLSLDQQTRWIKLDASPLGSKRMSGVIQDITERKTAEVRLAKLNEALERVVQERTQELRESIEELETFSSSVAHDLRSPIRAIVGFSSLLIDEHPQELSEDSLMLLRRIATEGERMGSFISALLNMSKLSQASVRPITTDLSGIASQIAMQLLESDPGRVADVKIAPDLVAQADPELIHSVIDNLIRNAWKFCAHSDVTRISFNAETQAGETVFCVRDNGCGFDMAFADRLFKPFLRLHANEDYAGTGLGLNLAQRIVKRHKGRIWAESTVGQGAAFYFTLPGFASGLHT
ncbi:response regulator [Hydrogenophaga sp.]|uniref:sensor histidine kinase n=1 Tax=Hydrogenophaga sp. TaxID=1904254 RepID=UPI00356717F0